MNMHIRRIHCAPMPGPTFIKNKVWSYEDFGHSYFFMRYDKETVRCIVMEGVTYVTIPIPAQKLIFCTFIHTL